MKEISLKASDEFLSIASILEMFLWVFWLADWADPSGGVAAAVPG